MTTTLDGVALDGATVALTLDGGRIAAVTPCTGPAAWQVMPRPVDPHLHLDKTFTAARAPAAAPGLFGAIDAAAADRAHWTAADIRARATRALHECDAAGMAALRSHVDWPDPAPPLAWSVLGELGAQWSDRLTLQRAPLLPVGLLGDPDHGPAIAAQVAATGDGVIGAFVYRDAGLEAKLAQVCALAAAHGLRLDFHVDEGLDPDARGFDAIVAAVAAHGLAGRVLCGHACALAVRPADDARRALDAAARAGVALCVLPTTNLWLQDAAAGRSPRQRGLAPVHEARAAGVAVVLGADNVADPFYPHGSYDPVATLRLATPAAQLDPGAWLDSITAAPARALGLAPARLAAGAPADFIALPGTDWRDALRRAGPRRIFRAGIEEAAQ